MPFVEVDMEQEARELEALINRSPEAKKTAENFDREYALRKKLVEARKSAGLTQKDLQEKTGLSQKAISRIETNTDVSPSVRTLIRYLGAIGGELDVLIKSGK